MAKAYDQAERDRIRRAIIAYMQKHDIGTPMMARRLINADGDEVYYKKLQRFLGSAWPPPKAPSDSDVPTDKKPETRVGDDFVEICDAFVARHCQDIEDPIKALGEQLHRVYGQRYPNDITGRYQGTVSGQSTQLEVFREGPFWRIVDRSGGDIADGVLIHSYGFFLAYLKDRARAKSKHYQMARRVVGFTGAGCGNGQSFSVELEIVRQ